MNDPLISVRKLNKSYDTGSTRLEILKNIDLDVYKGEAHCIVGESGAGKSTLLHIMGTLDRPTSGTVSFEGKDLSLLSDAELASFRNESLGFVFQFHHLLGEFTAIENIMMPAQIHGLSMSECRARAKELLNLLGIAQRSTHYPSEMSGGEQQRVAIARALVMKPKLLLADEPTGNLDMNNTRIIQDLFFSLQDRLNLSLVVVTHDSSFASRFPHRRHLKDGVWN